MKTLEELSQYYAESHSFFDIEDSVRKYLSIDLKTCYNGYILKNPILVAPGQLTVNSFQVDNIYRAGYAGCVLKSVVGESEGGLCSMKSLRKKETKIKTFYQQDDKECAKPIIHWDGRLDVRNLNEYLKFVKNIKGMDLDHFAVIGSFLCHLSKYNEEFHEKEWIYTAGALKNHGCKVLEIDFCPYLGPDGYWSTQEDILRWYQNVPQLIKSHFPQIKIYPKIINTDFGIGFQIKMAEGAVKGGSDGLVIGNRIYKEQYGSGHGGEDLRLLNLQQIKKIKKLFPGIEISATGGIYSGKHVFEYLKAGAKNVQLLSYIMGKVKKPFIKNGNKFENVFHKLLFDSTDGLLFYMLKEGYKNIYDIGKGVK